MLSCIIRLEPTGQPVGPPARLAVARQGVGRPRLAGTGDRLGIEAAPEQGHVADVTVFLAGVFRGVMPLGCEQQPRHGCRCIGNPGWHHQLLVSQESHEQEGDVVHQWWIDHAEPGVKCILGEPAEEAINVGRVTGGKHCGTLLPAGRRRGLPHDRR